MAGRVYCVQTLRITLTNLIYKNSSVRFCLRAISFETARYLAATFGMPTRDDAL